jgi:hypothetical protein
LEDDRWLPKNEEIIFITLFVLLIVLGLLGNGLVCFIVLRKGQLVDECVGWLLAWVGVWLLSCFGWLGVWLVGWLLAC